MQKVIVLACVAMCLSAGIARAAEAEMPKPAKEHEWLQQFAGEWDVASEMIMDPAQPAVKSKGTESSRMLGGFFAVCEIKSELMGTPFSGILTLGYDTEKKKYTATWIDSMTGKLWVYGGTVDAAGKILTLEAEGPCPMQPGKLVKFRDVIEFKNKDHKVVTSSMELDGKWMVFQTANHTRKK